MFMFFGVCLLCNVIDCIDLIGFIVWMNVCFDCCVVVMLVVSVVVFFIESFDDLFVRFVRNCGGILMFS